MGWFGFGAWSKRKLAEIDRDLQSPLRDTRTSAVVHLVQHVRTHAGVHALALPVLSRVVESEQDPWIAGMAARGIQHIVGQGQARDVWLRLLRSPAPAMVEGIVAQLDDPFFIPILLDMLGQPGGENLRGSLVATLARLRAPEVLPMLLEDLASPETRSGAIQLLAEFGDPGTIRHIEPYLTDMTETPQPDDRGCVVRISHLAEYAIRRIRYINGQE